MTRKEACEVLWEKFPTQQFYVEVTYWSTVDHSMPYPPRFNVCVYDIEGDGKNAIANGKAENEPCAVEAEADAMFAGDVL